MSGNNLLIVFGGTEEGSNPEISRVQSIFSDRDLDNASVDVLQFNLLTEKPTVTLRKVNGEVQDLLTGSYTGLPGKSPMDAVRNGTGNDVFDDPDDGPMRQLELAIESIKWVDAPSDYGSEKFLKDLGFGNKISKIAALGPQLKDAFNKGGYPENGSLRGLNVDGYQTFSDRARDVIFSYIKNLRQGQNYDNIIVMGHSRGAALATQVAGDLYDKYSENFLRLVLQDPVSKNVGDGGDSAVINQGRDVVKKLADAGKEVHIISKTELRSGNGADTSIRNYETYAPELIGTHYFYPDDKLATFLGEVTSRESENRITDSKDNEPDMRNVYFHLAHMQHGYMLQGPSGKDGDEDYKALHQGFGAYKNIISTEPWTTTYSDEKKIDIDQLVKSETLQRYIKGERSATENGKYNPDTRTLAQRLNPLSKPKPSYEPNNLPDGDDPLNEYYRAVSVNYKNQGQDRQHALVHSLGYKVLIPTIKIDVSAYQVSESEAPEVLITAKSNRTFKNEQTVTLQFPQNSSGVATLGEDYTLSGFEQSGNNYTITIPADKDTATATLKIVDDDQEEELEKINISIIKDGVINKTKGLGEIKGFNGADVEINIIDTDEEKIFSELETSLVGVNGRVDTADFNSDGSIDILLTGVDGSSTDGETDYPKSFISKLYINDGSGSFSENTSIPSNMLGVAAATADFDNDNDIDILLPVYSDSKPLEIDKFKIYTNDGSGQFSESTSSLKGSGNPFTPDVATADFDNDNDIDILLRSGATLTLYTNDGSGGFTENTSSSLTGIAASGLVTADFNNDGSIDILMTSVLSPPSSGEVSQAGKVYINDGSGGFTENTSTSLPSFFNTHVATADFDNDNDIDILLTGGTYKESIGKVYTNDGSGGFSENTEIFSKGIEVHSLATADFDNDNDIDILLTGTNYSNSLSQSISKVYINDASGRFSENTNVLLADVSRGQGATADFDNDNDIDILLTGSIRQGEKPISKIFQNNLEIIKPPEIQFELDESETLSFSGSSDEETEKPAPPQSAAPPIEEESTAEEQAPPQSAAPTEAESSTEETVQPIANSPTLRR